MTTFYIVRHGQTDLNVKQIIQGHGDAPLNEMGELQARAASVELRDIHFDFAFSSDLLRAKRTAEIIALERDLAIQATEVLRERDFGISEGQPYGVFIAYDELYQKLSEEEKRKYKPVDGYESNEELIGRLITFLRETALAYPEKCILVASHGDVIMTFLRHLGYLTYKDRVALKNTGYVILETDGVEFNVIDVNGLVEDEIKFDEIA